MEARGVGFSEMQSFWSLPFHDYATIGDVCVSRYHELRIAYLPVRGLEILAVVARR